MSGIARRHFIAGALAASGVAALSTSALAATTSKKQKVVKPKLPVIAVDAGHGGKDPGAIGQGGNYEKDITIAVAHQLAKKLEATGRFKVLLTRSSDLFIPLPDRVRLARAGDCALFVSLHADFIPNPAIRGFSVYTLSEKASDDFAGALAKRENAVDRFGGVDLSRHPREVRTILLDLMHRETSNNSALMAETVVNTLNPPFPALENPHRQANFAVLRAPDIPSVLVEMGFLSNAKDEKLLLQRSYQGKLSDRLTASINGYFRSV